MGFDLPDFEQVAAGIDLDVVALAAGIELNLEALAATFTGWV